MIPHFLRVPIRSAMESARAWKADRYVSRLCSTDSALDLDSLAVPSDFQARVCAFVDSLRTRSDTPQYLYAGSCTKPTLYASVYACMTYSITGRLKALEDIERARWVRYFDSYQEEKDGLFYDGTISSQYYADSDWWGARHLALHLISAYTALKAKPPFPFVFLQEYFAESHLAGWLDSVDWSSAACGEGDFDNKLMNIGGLLQYSRDQWSDSVAGKATEFLKSHLLENVNPRTGMWGGFSDSCPRQRSRMVQFAYHIFPLFFYDGYYNFDWRKIVDIVLATRNKYGGFGVLPNSSACEDMDSLYILIKAAPFVPEKRDQIMETLRTGFCWLLRNQLDDGGFVFRLNEPFAFGDVETSSQRNESAMLATWFRTLNIAYLSNALRIQSPFVLNRCPGYEFP